jgi:hypothetical protein
MLQADPKRLRQRRRQDYTRRVLLPAALISRHPACLLLPQRPRNLQRARHRAGAAIERVSLPDIVGKRVDVLSPRMVRIVTGLAGDWRRLDERIETVTDEIGALAKNDDSCRRVMTVPGIGPIISSAMVTAIGNGAAFARGRNFSAWLGLVPKQMSTGDRTIPGATSSTLPPSQNLKTLANYISRPPLRACCLLHVSDHGLAIPIVRVYEQGEHPSPRNQLGKQFQPLGYQLNGKDTDVP